MKADINAIAQACAVSKTTVSKVFTQKAGVSAAMRHKILETARKLNYTPKQVMAQDTIAIIASNCTFSEGASFRALLVASVMKKLTDSGYLIKIITSEDLDCILQSYTKVAVLIAAGSEAETAVAKLTAMEIPTITINEIFPQCHAVCSDHAQAVELAVDHLAQMGHTRITLVLDTGKSWGGKERIRGYQNAMRRHRFPPMTIRTIEEAGSVVECLHGLRGDRATAALIEGESYINEAVYMLSLLQIRVPDDLSVISSEITRSSRWFMPPHTTTLQDLEAMSSKIVEHTRAIIHAEAPEPTVMMLPSSLICRNSVRPLPSATDERT